jgi:diguanylate cyclase (GGDEF)-like protein
MFDVDEFKRVNDSYGHLMGDHLLASVGRRLNEVLRTSDVKCRYGGDEFVLILPDTPADGARQLAESIREELARIAVPAVEEEVRVTVSIGLATSDGSETEAKALIARADAALYRAKRGGRNRVHVADLDRLSSLRLATAAS